MLADRDRIFKNPLTTAAAIDRLVHHATILEIDRTSVRAEDAKLRKEGHQPNDNSPTSTTKNRRRQLPNQPRKR